MIGRAMVPNSFLICCTICYIYVRVFIRLSDSDVIIFPGRITPAESRLDWIVLGGNIENKYKTRAQSVEMGEDEDKV